MTEEKTLKVEELIALANFIFEQNKMQQETKDTWFGHYLSIIAGVSALSTICLAVLQDSADIKEIYFFVGVAFIFTGVLGYFFFWIFLCQRSNYWKNYKLLNEIQILLIELTTKRKYSYFYPIKDPFAKRKCGADFYASIVENLMISICCIVGTLFLLLSYNFKHLSILIISVCIFLVVFVILFRTYLIFEKKNKI